MLPLAFCGNTFNGDQRVDVSDHLLFVDIDPVNNALFEFVVNLHIAQPFSAATVISSCGVSVIKWKMYDYMLFYESSLTEFPISNLA